MPALPSSELPNAAAVLDVLIQADVVQAVVLLVASPLGLLMATARRPMLRRHLLAYCRASSLLMTTVHLRSRRSPWRSLSATFILIPIALWMGNAPRFRH